VQSHVGFLLGVAAVLGVAGVGLGVRAVRGGRAGWSGRRGRARLASLAATGVVLAATWAPPLVQQLTASPGNLGTLYAYFRAARPSSTLAAGLSWLSAEAGALPAYVAGVPQRHPFATPPSLPGWAGATALLAFLAATAVAARRRAGGAGPLAALSAAVGVAAVVAVARVSGPLFDYLVRWVVVAGLVLWISVGVSLVGRDPAGRADGLPTRRRVPATAMVLAATTVLAAVAVLAGPATADGLRARTGWTSTDGTLPRLAAQARSWLGPRAADPVRVDFGPSTRPFLLGTATPGTGLVLLLAKRGVHVQLDHFWDGAYGRRISADLGRVRWVLVVAYADGSSPPPAPGQQVVARAGDLQVYGGPALR
ncbi:MAG TPA: hypothetical protein VKP11_12115, partial [Frankiaceae bacterium]|nr:hypothetical protein [Frankiaceae bacterium]